MVESNVCRRSPSDASEQRTITSANTPQHCKVSISGTDDLRFVNFGIYQRRAVGLVIITPGARARIHELAGPISFPI